MQLRANLKAVKILEGNTKQDIIDQLLGAGMVVVSDEEEKFAVNCYGGPDDNNGIDVFPVSFNKFRSKRGGKKAHWIAHVYCINLGALFDLNLKIEQHARHFTISNAEV